MEARPGPRMPRLGSLSGRRYLVEDGVRRVEDGPAGAANPNSAQPGCWCAVVGGRRRPVADQAGWAFSCATLSPVRVEGRGSQVGRGSWRGLPE